MDRRYEILCSILDALANEAKTHAKLVSRYAIDGTPERQAQVRALALVNLYLQSTYGISDVRERDQFVTDGSGDGGIDGYYIDTDRKIIDVVQSKFRANPTNFEKKFIEPGELAKMDVDEILSGQTHAENGNSYNGRIQGLQRRVSELPDVERYKVQVTIMANLSDDGIAVAKKLFKEHEINILSYERVYRELVLPALRGEQFYDALLRLRIDLSNKSSASLLSAEISTRYGPCEVTVVLVPTLEVAQFMRRYKNGILKYNPRSYLEFRDQTTNAKIRESITDRDTGEFALLNNGITMISDETSMNTRVGVKNQARIELVNPQIINGGQTAFTLSRILDDEYVVDENIFDDKEVLLKIITIPSLDESDREDLIAEISSATNSQTAVSHVDRSASNALNREVAERIFMNTGLLYEPKRGEYGDAVYNAYIDRVDVLDRALFTRLIYMAEGAYSTAQQRKMMRATGGLVPAMPTKAMISQIGELYSLYIRMRAREDPTFNAELVETLAKVQFAFESLRSPTHAEPPSVDEAVAFTADHWQNFHRWAARQGVKSLRNIRDPDTFEVGQVRLSGFYRSKNFPELCRDYLLDHFSQATLV